MKDLTPQKKSKLLRLAKIADEGEIGIVDELNILEDKIEDVKVELADVAAIAAETQKMEGPRGEKGDQGDVGEKGEQGDRGEKGEAGVDGKNGATGEQGDQGERGEDGYNGVDGVNGKDGSPDTGEQIVTKINDLSVDDDEKKIDAKHIKNLPKMGERIVERIGVGGISQVYHDNTLTGQGTQSSPLSATNDTTATWGSITGTLSDQTDLQTALNNLVPYTGASQEINLNGQDLINPGDIKDASEDTVIEVGLRRLYSSTNGVSIDFSVATTPAFGDYAALFFGNLTSSRIFTYPDASGTVALTSDLTGFVTGATDSTLTLTGTTLGINLSSENSWLKAQNFKAAPSDLYALFAETTDGLYLAYLAEQDSGYAGWFTSPGGTALLGSLTHAGHFTGSVNFSSQTASTIASFDASKNLISLSTGTYPTLTELSFGKGVTSPIQTQINAKFTLPSLTSGSVLFSNGTTIAQDNTNFFWDDSNNRLGISNAAPAYKLDVSGDINITTGSRFRYNTVPILFGDTARRNYFVGNSGNLTMTGTDNSGIGNRALESNTTGSNNYAGSTQALFSNQGGGQNVGLGFDALFSNVSGSGNTAIGFFSLFATTGSSNVAIGQYSGRYETGSSKFYVGNRDYTNTAGEIAGSLIYGAFSTTPNLQTLKFNVGVLTQQYDISNYWTSTVGSTGGVTFDAVGSGAGFTFSDDVIMADAKNIQTNATTGTKIGTATSQKLSLWNATPIIQPTTGVAAATFVANTSLIANDTATFDGYTIGQVVKALRNIGLLA